MSRVELKKLEGINREELSMLEVAHAILEETGDVYDFTELLVLIQEHLSLSEAELESKMARFYTDINIDGRFISLGENRWGLRAWYPIDSIDEEIVSSIDDEDLPRRRRRTKKRKVNAFGDGEDVIDYNDDDPEDIDDIYDDIDEEDLDDDFDEEDDTNAVVLDINKDDEEDDDNEELGVYARDLDELGDDVEIEEEEFDEEIDDEDLLDDDIDEDLEEDFEEEDED